uniref:(northern house mosquito) hypothetical protein n=1 Tax=Culex pipiens TaxID=7175 RepID=A0A8D8KHK0_CULPI
MSSSWWTCSRSSWLMRSRSSSSAIIATLSSSQHTSNCSSSRPRGVIFCPDQDRDRKHRLLYRPALFFTDSYCPQNGVYVILSETELSVSELIACYIVSMLQLQDHTFYTSTH